MKQQRRVSSSTFCFYMRRVVVCMAWLTNWPEPISAARMRQDAQKHSRFRRERVSFVEKNPSHGIWIHGI